MRLSDKSSVVDGIPVRVLAPPAGERSGKVALWIPRFGGDTSEAVPALRVLGNSGHLAVTMDPVLHGARAVESPQRLFKRTFSNFRRYMWSLMGGTALDCLRIIEWASEEYDCPNGVLTGGVSMGGDVALALAAVDPRVSHVAGIAMSPDWNRPGMTMIDTPGAILEQGSPTVESALLCGLFNPASNIGSFSRAVSVRFDSGHDDTHIQLGSILAFRDAVDALRADVHGKVEVRVHDKLNHAGTVFSPALTESAASWLADEGTHGH